MNRQKLRQLAEKYVALEKSDNQFQRRARILQSMWREEQGYAVGEHVGRNGARPLGSRLVMPWAEETLANFLNDTIRAVVRAEVLDTSKSAGKLYGRPRIFNDLLSSQPLCFNLFAMLQQDPTLATAVFGTLTDGRTGGVTGIEFEYSPGRGDPRYTGDRSAFDVFVRFDTPSGGRGFIGIEVKYHENLGGKAADHRARYDQIADQMGCFDPATRPQLREQPLQQVWRDHLLAGVLRIADHYDDGFFVFLHPRDNRHCASAVREYRQFLTDETTFAAWTLEDVAAAIRRHTDAPWIAAFRDRYLAFEKVDRG